MSNSQEPTPTTPFQKLIATPNDRTLLFMRLVLAGIMWPHGAQHFMGWFGGYGFSGTHGWMTGTLGFPSALAALAIVLEFFAPFLLAAGLLGRAAALSLVGILVFAATTHYHNGFFMNWFGILKPGEEGFEYHIIGSTLGLVLAVRGAGALSLDRVLLARAGSQGAVASVRPAAS